MDKIIVSQKNKNICIDCGAQASRRSKRCMACKGAAQIMANSGYVELAERHDLSWIGENPGSTHLSTRWRCANGHEWDARYSSIRRGSGCPICATERKKRKQEDYHALARQCGLTWIGEFPANTHAQTKWECQYGHQWMSTYKNISNGRGCPLCSKIQPDDYRKLANRRGIAWIGEFPQSVSVKTEWRCAVGHTWTAEYRSIYDGKGCPYCSRIDDRFSAEDYHALANKLGIQWIGELPQSAKTKTEWQCPSGHCWFAGYFRVKNSLGCPHCQKVQEEDYRRVAEQSGLIWIGPFVDTTVTPTEWQCQNGHRWMARYNSIQQGTGCPQCLKYQTEDYFSIANERGIQWIGKPVKNANTKTEWQCSQGHRWFANYHSLRRGHGCPLCHDLDNSIRTSKPQRAIFDMLGGITNHRIGRYSVDVVLQLPLANIAVEYDSWWWHGKKQDADKRKVEMLITRGWKVLKIKSGTMIPTFDQIQGCIFDLLAGADYAEIVMPDWGKGKAR